MTSAFQKPKAKLWTLKGTGTNKLLSSVLCVVVLSKHSSMEVSHQFYYAILKRKTQDMLQ